MDHLRIIRRAFDITRIYRALWLFGVLIALTTSRGGGNGGGGGNGVQFDGDSDFWRNFPNIPDMPGRMPNIPQEVISGMVAGGIALLCVAVILGIAFTILRYVSMNASMKMVDGFEGSGERVGVRQGFRLGWSRPAFRMWLVDLIFGILGFLVVIALLLVVAAPQLLWLTQNDTAGIIAVVMSVGLLFLVILLMVVGFSLLGIVVEVIRRVLALEGLGVMDGIRRGWQMVRRRLGDSIIMGLILFGIGLVFAILMIPLVLMLLVVAALAGGLPALLAGAITNIFAGGSLPQIVAGIVGVPIFLLVLTLPLLFVGGLYEVFTSSTWTLTYRELLALEAVRSEPEVIPPAAVE